MLKKTKNVVLLIFILSTGLRLSLAYINRAANDNHIEVISWIVDKHELPGRGDCWECFQPKFFYVISAGVVMLFDIHSTEYRVVTIQFLNALFGFFILLFFWKFIKSQSLSEWAKVLVFAFFAFNPCLTGINVQVTNDTLEILGGVMAIYFCDLFFSRMTLSNFIFLVFSAAVAALTKATGILLFVVICIFFTIKMLSMQGLKQRLSLFKYLISAVVIFSALVIFAGGYYSYYKKNHSLPSSTWKEDPPAAFFKDTYIARPGIVNLADGFFTFRYFNMIRQPYINNDADKYPLHRTSLWSQLYGRTVFMHFDQWPPEWQTQAPLVVFTGRVLITLGLIPLILFICGIYLGINDFLKNIAKSGRTYLAKNNNYLHLGVTIALLAVAVNYCYHYRDFSAMKSIYIFPGLISFLSLFIEGYKAIKRLTMLKFINTVLVIMVIFSVADIGYLIYQLHYRF